MSDTGTGAAGELATEPTVDVVVGRAVETATANRADAWSALNSRNVATRPQRPRRSSGQRGPGQAASGGPERIDHYEIIRELGRGGMGAVFLARDLKLARRVAIKRLQNADAALVQRFVMEARATARCRHDNIVIIHEVGARADGPYMVLEYLRGEPLSAIMTGEPLAPGRAVEIMAAVVRALICAHGAGIVHRDLKPGNIFLTDAGTVKVLDFGIAKFLPRMPGLGRAEVAPALSDAVTQGIESDELAWPDELTRQGALMGTVPYMSPEQWAGEGIDYSTDIWAVGIILHQLLTGRHPLAPKSGIQLAITGHLGTPMPSAGAAGPELPAALVAVIDRCLEKDSRQRFASAEALLEALEPWLPMRPRSARASDENPYAGLRAFQAADAERFFGREREVAKLVAMVRDVPLIALVGPSGVGKSSLVRAGLIPALTAREPHSREPGQTSPARPQAGWDSIIIRPGRDPLRALARVLTDGDGAVLGSGSGSDADLTADMDIAPASVGSGDADRARERDEAVCERLRAEPGYLGRQLRTRARRTGRRLLLFVDQGEELYTLGAEVGERRAFTACLAGVADDPEAPLRVVLSIRADFLGRVAEDARFMAELARGMMFVSAPDRAQLRESLVRPAELAGYRFESEPVVEDMLDALAGAPGALPLLQFTAAALWDARDPARRCLSDASYEALGGVSGALAGRADATLAALPGPERALLRVCLLRLVTAERTRALMPMSELCQLGSEPAAVTGLIERLASARLVVVHADGDGGDGGDGQPGASQPRPGEGAQVELVHESLIDAWPRLRRWLDEDQGDSAMREQLGRAARQWADRGRSPGLLWRDEAAHEAARWRRRDVGPLTDIEGAFLDATLALAERARRRRRLAISASLAVLSLMVVAAAIALVTIRSAEREAHQQAEIARAAERQVRDQLAVIEAKERARQAEKERADRATGEVALSREELAAKNIELEAALTTAEGAREQAETARAQAQAAEAEARALYERERKRVRRLEQQVGSFGGALQ